MSTTKRIRRSPEEAKLLILETAEKIMLEEGYATVTVRAVAKRAGVSSTLLHYYYPTADDLIIALYRHVSNRDLKQLQKALSAKDPIMALWDYHTNAARTALGIEFLALANHRKLLRTEIARFAEHARSLQTKILTTILDESCSTDTCSAECLSMLMTSVSRNLIIESGVGISSGHAEAKAFVEQALKKFQKTKQK